MSRAKDLSLESCRWLRDNGFPQLIGGGTWCYINDRLVLHPRIVQDWTPNDGEQYVVACPTLEPLLEWAGNYLDKKFGKIGIVGVEINSGLYRATGGLYHSCEPNQEWAISDLDPKEAIVKLLKQVLTKE